MKCFKYLLALIFLSQLSVSAQTSYYKLLKSEKDGRTSTNVSGGQFITINGRSCYESDSKGYTVNNGVLYLYKLIDGGKCFEGESFYGKGTRFIFSADMKSLMVSTFSGDKYYYGKAAAPAGVTTSSLIAKKENATKNNNTNYNNNNYNYNNPLTTPSVPYTAQSPSVNDSQSSSSSRTTSHFEKAEYGYKPCHLCHGTGTCQTCLGKGLQFSPITKADYLPCPNCDSNHNGKCSICHGTGKVYGRIN